MIKKSLKVWVNRVFLVLFLTILGIIIWRYPASVWRFITIGLDKVPRDENSLMEDISRMKAINDKAHEKRFVLVDEITDALQRQHNRKLDRVLKEIKKYNDSWADSPVSLIGYDTNWGIWFAMGQTWREKAWFSSRHNELQGERETLKEFAQWCLSKPDFTTIEPKFLREVAELECSQIGLTFQSRGFPEMFEK